MDANKKVSKEKQNLRRPDLIDAEPVKKAYVPEGFDSEDDFISDMRAQYQHDVEFDRINRFEMIDDLRFAAGEQWDPMVLQQRKGLPNLVINTIPQFTAQLVGDWRESRKAIKVVPSNDEDTDVADIREDLVRKIEIHSRADRSYDQAFESMVQCGDGAFKVTVEYARDDVFDQDIFIRPIEDVLSVVWDRFSVDPTGRDARRVFVDDRIPKDEFERKWPQEGSGSDLLQEDKIDRVTMAGWSDEESYRVTEYWRMIEREKTLALFENGKMYEVDDSNLEQMIEEERSANQDPCGLVSVRSDALLLRFKDSGRSLRISPEQAPDYSDVWSDRQCCWSPYSLRSDPVHEGPLPPEEFLAVHCCGTTRVRP